MKCFPLAYHAPPVAWAALALRPRVRTDDICEIRLETYRLAVAMIGSERACWAPGTRVCAVRSAPYVIALALLDGDITPGSFSDARLADPAVAALMAKVVVRESIEPSAAYPEATPTNDVLPRLHRSSAAGGMIHALRAPGASRDAKYSR